MHHCLQVPEIINNIFKQIYDPDELPGLFNEDGHDVYTPVLQRLSLHCLVALAQTCQLFKEPALNILWHWQPHLNHLLDCLPAGTIRTLFYPGTRSRTSMKLERDITPMDLERVKYYGCKIKHLGDPTRSGIAYSKGPAGMRDMLIVPNLFRALGKDILLPNLARLNIMPDDFEGLCWPARLVIGPSLHSIHIMTHRETFPTTTGDTFPWLNIHSSLKKISGSLRNFSIALSSFSTDENDIYDIGQAPELMSLLQKIQSPTRIDIANVHMDQAMVHHLSQVGTLRHLGLTLTVAVVKAYAEMQRNNLAVALFFVNLESLLLQISELQPCGSFLETIASDKLHSVKIVRPHHYGSYWDVDSLLELVGNRPFAQSLRTVELCRATYDFVPASDVSIVTPKTIHLLTKIRNLQTMRISLNGQVRLDRATLHVMARTWPHLKVIDLAERTWVSHGFTPSVTLVDLLTFTASLPDLEDVKMRVDAKMDFTSYTDLGDDMNISRVRTIDFCTSPISVPEPVATVLGTYFPDLEELALGWHYPNQEDEPLDFALPMIESEYSDKWGLVEDTLQSLLQSRGSTSRW